MTVEAFKIQDQILKSFNPATGECLGDVSVTNPKSLTETVQKSKQAFLKWSALSFNERARFILAARDYILQNQLEVATLISKENGKPIQEALGNDVMPVLDLMTHFAKTSKSLLKKQKIKLGKWGVLGRSSHIEFYPYGVVAVISPWNFPLSIPLGEISMALMAGNTVVLKPSEYTPLVAEKIKQAFQQAGLPQDVLQVVHGAGDVGAALIESGVDKVVFTGSVPTGKKIMSACAKNLTSLTLELGGKDPFVVFEDADLDVASSAAVWGAFGNSGQICASVERLYVHQSIQDQFIDLVVKKTKMLRQGLGQDPNVDVAAMTAPMQVEKVLSQIQDARSRGAIILTGGQVHTQGASFLEPTVITNVDHSFTIVCEESFGPILPIMTFTDEADAIQKANHSDFALNAYLWTKNKARAQRVASQIVAGTVNINETVFTHALPQTPWGGPKNSGMGRTHGATGLMDLVQIRHVHTNHFPSKKNAFWWFAYSSQKIELLMLLSQALFGKGFNRLKSFIKFIRGSLKVNSN